MLKQFFSLLKRYILPYRKYLTWAYSAQAKVAVGRKNDALVIPYTCISQDETQHEYVMAVEEGRAVKKYNTVGYEMENSVEVLSGVEEDTLLISDPESVRHGERVTARLENS